MPRRIRPTKLELNNATDALRRAGELEGYQEVVRRLTDARAQVLQILGEPNGKSSREAARRMVAQRDLVVYTYRKHLEVLRKIVAKAGKSYADLPLSDALEAMVEALVCYRNSCVKESLKCALKSNASPTR